MVVSVIKLTSSNVDTGILMHLYIYHKLKESFVLAWATIITHDQTFQLNCGGLCYQVNILQC